MKNNYHIGIVIPLFHTKYIDEIIVHIKNTVSDKNTTFCFVNDGQESIKLFFDQKSLPENFSIIHLDRNQGFASANNAGWQYLIDKNSEIKILGSLNDDTELSNGWLDPLIEILNRDEHNAVAMPIMTSDEGIASVWELQGKDKMRLAKSSISGEEYVSAINGFCFMARKEALEKVGFFDRNYLNGCEDIDLGIKLLCEGYRMVVTSRSSVFHKAGESRYLKTANTQSFFNHQYMAKKWAPGIEQYNNLDSNGFLLGTPEISRHIEKKKYRFALHVLGFNCTKTILQMLDNCGPYVEKIFVAYSEKPWSYNPDVKDSITNPTPRSIFEKSKHFNKIEIIDGYWDTDEDQRNSCVERAKEEGFDFLIIQDADEFYLSKDFKDNLNTISENPDWDVYLTPWHIFWKSLRYVIVNRKGNNIVGYPQFAINLNRNVKFKRARTPDSSDNFLLKGMCYHPSFVLSDEELYTKINTWGHAHQFKREKWYKNKWLKWNLNTKYLHPVSPWEWNNVEVFKGDLPKELVEIAPDDITEYQDTFIDKIRIFFNNIYTLYKYSKSRR